MSEMKRKSGSFEVSGGSGNITINGVYIKSGYVGVKGPSNSASFEVIVEDADTDHQIQTMRSRTGDNGNATAKAFQLPLYNITIKVSEADEDGTYTYLLMG